MRLELKAERFGLYTLKTDVELSDGTRQAASLVCAKLPEQPQLSAEQKQRSPYGVNVNGGRSNLQLEPFRKAGIVWFRDYAFSLEWLQRAKGDNRQYEGWPWYPTILRRYADAGALVLPCLMRSIQPPQIKDGKPAGRIGPDRQWIRDVADARARFPAADALGTGQRIRLGPRTLRRRDGRGLGELPPVPPPFRGIAGTARRRRVDGGRARPGRHLAAARRRFRPQRRF